MIKIHILDLTWIYRGQDFCYQLYYAGVVEVLDFLYIGYLLYR